MRTADRMIVGSAQTVVERVAELNGISGDYTEGILSALLKQDSMTQWGLSNAVTEFCQTVESYEASTEMERVGGAILELSGTQWRELVAA
jgi:hypothetical protein